MTRRGVYLITFLTLNTVVGFSQIPLDSLYRQLHPRFDSLRGRAPKLSPDSVALGIPEKILAQQTRIDSIKQILSLKIESFKKLQEPNSNAIKSLDSLSNKLDSLKLSLLKPVQGASGRMNSIQSELNSKLVLLEYGINSKLQALRGSGGPIDNLSIESGLGKIPKINVGQLSLSESSSISVSDIVPNTHFNSPVQSIGINPTQELSNNDLVNKFPDTPDLSIDGVPKTEDLAKLKNLNGDNVSQIIENNLTEVEQLNQLKTELSPANDYTAMIIKWNSDPQVTKEMAISKAKHVAINHFAGHEQELQTAMSQLAKLKLKAPDKEEVVSLFASKRNVMKDKPLRDRIVPGLSFQIHLGSNIGLDMNPYLGYKISGHWQIGLGWNERLVYSLGKGNFTSQYRVYGARSFVQFKIKNAFAVKAEAELQSAFVEPYLLRPEQAIRQWVWSYFVGFRRDFKLFNKISANTQVLYNLYDPMKKSPYGNRLNIRMGAEFPFNKKVSGKLKS